VRPAPRERSLIKPSFTQAGSLLQHVRLRATTSHPHPSSGAISQIIPFLSHPQIPTSTLTFPQPTFHSFSSPRLPNYPKAYSFLFRSPLLSFLSFTLKFSFRSYSEEGGNVQVGKICPWAVFCPPPEIFDAQFESHVTPVCPSLFQRVCMHMPTCK